MLRIGDRFSAEIPRPIRGRTHDLQDVNSLVLLPLLSLFPFYSFVVLVKWTLFLGTELPRIILYRAISSDRQEATARCDRYTALQLAIT